MRGVHYHLPEAFPTPAAYSPRPLKTDGMQTGVPVALEWGVTPNSMPNDPSDRTSPEASTCGMPYPLAPPFTVGGVLQDSKSMCRLLSSVNVCGSLRLEALV